MQWSISSLPVIRDGTLHPGRRIAWPGWYYRRCCNCPGCSRSVRPGRWRCRWTTQCWPLPTNDGALCICMQVLELDVAVFCRQTGSASDVWLMPLGTARNVPHQGMRPALNIALSPEHRSVGYPLEDTNQQLSQMLRSLTHREAFQPDEKTFVVRTNTGGGPCRGIDGRMRRRRWHHVNKFSVSVTDSPQKHRSTEVRSRHYHRMTVAVFKGHSRGFWMPCRRPTVACTARCGTTQWPQSGQTTTNPVCQQYESSDSRMPTNTGPSSGTRRTLVLNFKRQDLGAVRPGRLAAREHRISNKGRLQRRVRAHVDPGGPSVGQKDKGHGASTWGMYI